MEPMSSPTQEAQNPALTGRSPKHPFFYRGKKWIFFVLFSVSVIIGICLAFASNSWVWGPSMSPDANSGFTGDANKRWTGFPMPISNYYYFTEDARTRAGCREQNTADGICGYGSGGACAMGMGACHSFARDGYQLFVFVDVIFWSVVIFFIFQFLIYYFQTRKTKVVRIEKPEGE
jgi:hypothetical protein